MLLKQVLRIPIVRRLSPDGVEFIEYLSDEVQDEVFQAMLNKLYKKFVLLNDTFENICEQSGQEEIRARLKRFYDAVGVQMFSESWYNLIKIHLY